jgi:hypothetical protein
MADGSGERRMVFDTRGRRKNVIRVVYAVLALLMGASLFLTVGPFSIGELFGTGGTSSDPSELFHEQSERIEGRLAKNPNDEGDLLALTRARIQAGNAQTEIDPQTGAPGIPPPEAVKDFDAALESWSRYLKQVGDEANPLAAQLVAQTFFTLAERGSSTLSDIEENLETAVKAQRIAAEARPNIGSLSSLAIYEYFNGNMAAGDKAAKQAAARAVSKPEAKNAEKQLNEYRRRAVQYVAQIEQVGKAAQKAGGEQLQNPLGGFGAGAVPGGE